MVDGVVVLLAGSTLSISIDLMDFMVRYNSILCLCMMKGILGTLYQSSYSNPTFEKGIDSLIESLSYPSFRK